MVFVMLEYLKVNLSYCHVSLETAISLFSTLLLKVHATRLPIKQKLIKIILLLCYQMVCFFVLFLVTHTDYGLEIFFNVNWRT